MSVFKDLLKSKCQDMVNRKARREVLLRILNRKGQEVEEATGLKVTVTEGPDENIWIDISSWPHPDGDTAKAIIFKKTIRVDNKGDDKFIFHYEKERYEHESAMFDVLAHDIACAMPSAEMQKVLGKEGSH